MSAAGTFHAPFIQAADGVDLAGVVTRSPERRRVLASDFPDLPVYDDLDQLLDAGVDAVTITTPPETRRQLVLQALAAGAHVIADKPFAPTAEGGRELDRAAEASRDWPSTSSTTAASTATSAPWPEY